MRGTRDDDVYSTIDRSASRMSRRSLGPPRPPPPKSRPESRIDTSDLSQLNAPNAERTSYDESKFNEVEFNRPGTAVITELPDAENVAAMEDEKRIQLIEHARKILEEDMKRRHTPKPYNKRSETEALGEHVKRSTNPFGTPGITPRPDESISSDRLPEAEIVAKKKETGKTEKRLPTKIQQKSEPIQIPPPPQFREKKSVAQAGKIAKPKDFGSPKNRAKKTEMENEDSLTNVDSQVSGLSNRLYVSSGPSIDTLDEILYKAESFKTLDNNEN